MRRFAAALACALWLVPALARAQNVQVELSDRPYYVGSPVQIVLLLDGFDSQPEPTVEVPDPPNGTLSSSGLQASRSTQVTIINGQMKRTESVQYEATFKYFATGPGKVTIGPFKVVQGQTTRSVAPVEVVINAVPSSDRLRIRLELPETTYVGARVPVTLEYWFEKELGSNMVSSSLQLPLATLLDGFRIASTAGSAEQQIELETGGEPLRLPARQRTERSGGQEFIVVAAPFELVPRKPGQYALGAASVTVEEGLAWRRDFLRGRAPTRVQRIGAVDRARTLVVKSVPAQGQPESFAGAVGRAFDVKVTTDRSVVQVGDPITLTIELSGDGALDTAGLPPLNAQGLLPPTDFSVPGQQLSGEIDGPRKRFSAVVRVLREGVTEIPALAYTYFDPTLERYQTVASRPIALSVGAARIVGSRDVVSALPPPELPVRPNEPAAPVPSFTGADLAIERDLSRLRASPSGLRGAAGIAGGIYVLALGALAGAVVDRRRRAVDPADRERRARVARELERATRAADQPGRSGVESLAGALRALRAELPAAAPSELEAFLARCDALVFAPVAVAALPAEPELFAALHREGVALARALAERAP